jgi:hypothetical protein
LDCVENLQTFRSEMLGQLKRLSLEWLMHVLWESMKEERVDTCPASADLVVLVRIGLCSDTGRRRE